MWKLFLDDLRDPSKTYPDRDVSDWVICRSFDEAVQRIEDLGYPDEIFFDHDLGNGPTGYDFAKFLVNEDLNKNSFPIGFCFSVHSANPIGAENIKNLLDTYLRFKNGC